ncbi:MAG: acyltransferase, partial [Peptococcaceae bacterium]|nr:acyltransferase [Peptococcaceae bacterium]
MSKKDTPFIEEKGHLGQVDYLRVFGLITIVIIHSIGFYHSIPELGLINHHIQGFLMNIMRYGRFVFMFVTGLVFFYNYQNKKISLPRFYKRRFNNLVLPYIIWTAIYLCLASTSELVAWDGLAGFIALWWQNIFSGNGFYHLYYIIVSIEFYLIFPFLLYIFKPVKKSLWITGIFIFGLALSFFYHYILENRFYMLLNLFDLSGWKIFITWLFERKNYLLFSYLPYYLMGGLAGLYWNETRRWVENHKKLIIFLFVTCLLMVGGDYLYSYLVLAVSYNLSASIFRPSMYLYSFTAIGFFLVVASAMERKGNFGSVIKILSGNSFGIYLIHPVVLFYLHTLYYWLNISLLATIVIDPILAVILSCLLSQLIGSSKYTGYMVGSFGNRNFKKI